MVVLLIFAIALIIALLISEFADRSIVSTAVLFLFAGALAGHGGFGWIRMGAGDPSLVFVAELALFSILFTDGMRIGIDALRSDWRLPARALLIGLPLTAVFMAVLARLLFDFEWRDAALLAAALSPTDPVFASAILGREEIPQRVRQLLNVESGVNDGLALPFVLFLLPHESGSGEIFVRLIAGVALGVILPWVILRIERLRLFSVAPRFHPLFIFGIGLLLFAITLVANVNPYLAAFAAGVTIASMAPERQKEFHGFGEFISELLKLAALLLFGSLLTWELIPVVGWRGVVFALLILLVARPVAIIAVIQGAGFGWREKLTAGWFGPKGFASVIYGILIADADKPHLLPVIAICIALSIVLHSSTDVPIARRFVSVQPDS